MSNKDLDCLETILDSINKIERYSLHFNNADEFFEDTKSFDAVLMNFIVIGEMVNKLSEPFKTANPEIEWWKIKGFRNIVVHDYFGIDAEEVWQIIHFKIPGLKLFIKEKTKQIWH